MITIRVESIGDQYYLTDLLEMHGFTPDPGQQARNNYCVVNDFNEFGFYRGPINDDEIYTMEDIDKVLSK